MKTKIIGGSHVPVQSAGVYMDKIIQLGEKYVFLQKDEITAYLLKNPFLIELLFDAHIAIQKYFDEYKSFFLKKITDPEYGDEQLFAGLQIYCSPDEALSKLHAFEREWWFGVMEQANGKLGFDVEFV